MTKKEDSGGGGKGQKGSIGHILKGIFKMKESKDKKEGKVSPKRQKSEPGKSAAEVDFGIETTEVLTHYKRPKPPQNRRRPRTRMIQV